MQLLKNLCLPFSLAFFSLTFGVFLIFLNRWTIVARKLLLFALCCLLVMSFRPFSDLMIWELERQYPPFSEKCKLSSLDYIVILTAWDSNNPTVPYTSNIGHRSALRLLEAQRVYRLHPASRIIICGSKTGIKLMARLLVVSGVKEGRIIALPARNTMDSAERIKCLVTGHTFALVTSAIHLRRSMDCFSVQGLRPIPAPADFLFGFYKRFPITLKKPLSYYVPNASSLWRSSLALYEYYGLLWYHIRWRVRKQR